MRESHRLWMRVCDLTEQADAEIDPLAEAWLRKDIERVRVDWFNAVDKLLTGGLFGILWIYDIVTIQDKVKDLNFEDFMRIA